MVEVPHSKAISKVINQLLAKLLPTNQSNNNGVYSGLISSFKSIILRKNVLWQRAFSCTNKTIQHD
jgi:hypothetical protein